MVEFVRVLGKGSIHASIETLSRRVLENGQICVSIKKYWNPGECREKVESLRVSKNIPGEYRKSVKSVLEPKNCRIRAGEYLEKVESVRVSKNCPTEYRERDESV